MAISFWESIFPPKKQETYEQKVVVLTRPPKPEDIVEESAEPWQMYYKCEAKDCGTKTLAILDGKGYHPEQGCCKICGSTIDLLVSPRAGRWHTKFVITHYYDSRLNIWAAGGWPYPQKYKFEWKK